MTSQPGPGEYAPGDPSMLKTFAAYLLGTGNVLLVAVLLVEGSWLYLWMVLMGRWDGFRMGEIPLGPLPIVLIPWLSYHSSQLFGQQRWSQEKAQWVTGLALVILILLVVRLENGGGYSLFDPGWIGFAAQSLVGSFPTSFHVTLGGSAYLWWRGYKLAQGGLDQEQVVHSFLVGLGGITFALLVWEIATRSGQEFHATQGQSVFITITFFFAGLSALAMSHLLRVNAEVANVERRSQPVGSHWLLVLPAVVTGVLTLGWIFTAIYSLDLWSPLVAMVSLAGDGLSFLLYYGLMPIVYLAVGFIYLFRWIAAIFGAGSQTTIQLPDLGALRAVPQTTPDAESPLWALVVKWLLVLLVAVVLVYFLARLLLRGPPRPTEAKEFVEDHESTGTWQDFIRDLLVGLLFFLNWLRDRSERVQRRLTRRIARRSGYPKADMEVRELYAHLLQETREAGFPRKEWQTPFEYLETLKRHITPERDELERITEDYVAVRYGEEPVTDEEKGLLNRLWRSLRARIRGQTEEDDDTGTQ
ncbi:MAG: DUF4129 domain-containing protein [Chloroflexi bacterium]|nr:DUF4129 domain-containing protein [Chloroflexota bacterium]